MSSEQRIPLVMTLDDAAATLEQVGGKGASLARLMAAGLPVPSGFHITTEAYRRFVAENGLQEQILAAVSMADTGQPATLDEASRQIGRLFANSVMPADIADAIRRAYAGLGGPDLPVAVRSSATAEDLPGMSFAGQQDSYLNMRGEEMVLDAVGRCWASLWTARAIGYRAHHGIAPQDVSLAVVVQTLVPADAAGIMFTANPITGSRDQLMINAAWGLGEAIVGGQVTPDTVVVDRASGKVAERQINAKEVMTVRTPEGTHEEPVPADLRNRAVLSPEEAAELARIGVRIEAMYGEPMDVEWARQDGRFHVVQARPITALPDAAVVAQPARAAEWRLPKPNGHYARGSVLELLPDPLSPLFATLGLPTWDRVLGSFARAGGLGSFFPGQMLVTINGYGYYDLTYSRTATARMLLALPRVVVLLPGLLRSSRPRWQHTRIRYGELVERWRKTELAGASAAQLLDGACEITDEAAQFYVSVQSGILPVAYMSEALFTLVYNRFLKRVGDPPALTFMLGYDSAPIQAEKSLYDMAQWVREQPELASALASMSGEQFTGAYREQAARATLDGAWPKFWRLLADHLARFGHALYDLDFAKAVLADDPVPVLETLKFFVTGRAADPHWRQAAAEATREQATQAMLASLGGLRLRIFRRLLRTAQEFAPLRENALADVGLGWPVLRGMLLEVGLRLAAGNAVHEPRDSFWLTLSELRGAAIALDAGQPPVDYRAVIAGRRATWESQRALTPPPALPIKGDIRFLGINIASMMPARIDQPTGNVLKGVAASPGRVTGSARVIHGPDEFGQMRQGDILVARITTPAWTPLFALAAGIVTDVGGPLSHSSIVAREYHIPAVLGTGMATEHLRSGQTVTVDGDAGTVTMSDSGE